MKFNLPTELENERADSRLRFQFVVRALRNLFTGLSKLSYADNFDQFTAEVEFTSTEMQIRNGFRDGSIPVGFQMLNGQGDVILLPGSTEWTSDYVYVRNSNGANGASATVMFFK